MKGGGGRLYTKLIIFSDPSVVAHLSIHVHKSREKGSEREKERKRIRRKGSRAVRLHALTHSAICVEGSSFQSAGPRGKGSDHIGAPGYDEAVFRRVRDKGKKDNHSL